MTASRRHVLQIGSALVAVSVLPPAVAQADELLAAVRSFTGGVVPRTGKVTLEIAQLVDNGNTVPLAIMVDSPMTASEHVTAIAVFNERNPQREVAKFSLGPRAGRAHVATRIRLATSQKLVAVARLSDGSFWQQQVDVVVTLAACIEGES